MENSTSAPYPLPQIVAEIGCNHQGDLKFAKELVDLAHQCGVKFVKFQKRHPKESVPPEQYKAPHPVPKNAFGQTYGEHREFLELSTEQHAEIKDYCEVKGMVYSTSVWDITSAREIIELNPKLLKVPSAHNNHWDLLRILRDEYRGQVHISLGMTPKKERERIVRFFEESDQAKQRLVLYSCTSSYPTQAKDVCLLDIRELKHKYDDRVAEVGFSGHHRGTALDIAAYTLGAQWIERHFTKDRQLKGTDQSLSLEADQLSQLVSDLNSTHQALKSRPEDILPNEQSEWNKLKYQNES